MHIPLISKEELKTMELTSSSVDGIMSRWKTGLMTMKRDLKLNETDVLEHETQLREMLNKTNALLAEADQTSAMAEKQNEILRGLRKGQVLSTHNPVGGAERGAEGNFNRHRAVCREGQSTARPNQT